MWKYSFLFLCVYYSLLSAQKSSLLKFNRFSTNSLICWTQTALFMSSNPWSYFSTALKNILDTVLFSRFSTSRPNPFWINSTHHKKHNFHIFPNNRKLLNKNFDMYVIPFKACSLYRMWEKLWSVWKNFQPYHCNLISTFVVIMDRSLVKPLLF